MTTEQFRTWIAPVSQAIAVLVAVGMPIFWGINLQYKVDRIETQLQAVLNSAPSGNSNSNLSSSSTACANLAERFANALAQGTRSGDSSAASIRGLMSEIGCMSPAKSSSK